MAIEFVDICCGLAWGDEGKGKLVSYLSKSGGYDFVCRWAGGNNAGHTIYKNGKKYKTHLIPSGVFYGVKSIIGPGCVVNVKSFFEEIEYLEKEGFDTSVVKISPMAHIITDKHIEEDCNKNKKLGTTAKGIGPCYRDKYERSGERIEMYKSSLYDYIWDGQLYGKILCEGAQGIWLDIDWGNYPYVTSSSTLPHGIGSLGIPMQKVRNIYGACKVYDTRSGYDPDFPEELSGKTDLALMSYLGEEYGTTTGRKRIVNYLNLEKLIKAINITGTTHVFFSKLDILEKCNIFKLFYKGKKDLVIMDKFKEFICEQIKSNCELVKEIEFSSVKEI